MAVQPGARRRAGVQFGGAGAACAARGRGRHNGRVPVVDLSSFPLRVSPRTALEGEHETVGVAVTAAGWPGVVLPPVELLGVVLYPVVELTGASGRLASHVYPQRCPTTLELWETWPELGQPSPLQMVGFVSTARPWVAAVAAAITTSGFGAGMALTDRRPAPLRLLDADASGLWVAGGGKPDGTGAEVWVWGRPGPVATATRTLTTRVMEERLFAHALLAGMVPAAS